MHCRGEACCNGHLRPTGDTRSNKGARCGAVCAKQRCGARCYGGAAAAPGAMRRGAAAVSYTHLTLPTICSV
eukprot:127202-Prymnesium_polylepis.1